MLKMNLILLRTYRGIFPTLFPAKAKIYLSRLSSKVASNGRPPNAGALTR